MGTLDGTESALFVHTPVSLKKERLTTLIPVSYTHLTLPTIA